MARGGKLKSPGAKIVKMRMAYENFMERQGFYIVLTLCVLTIILTAVFTYINPKPIQDTPTAPNINVAAEDPSVQRLKDVLTPSPKPTLAAPAFVFPLPTDKAVYRTFDGARPAYFDESRLWQLHPAIDIRSNYGQSVYACADGTVDSVIQTGSDSEMLVIAHANGYISRYRGLVSISVKQGDTVKAGQVVANAGYGPLIEQSDGSHVHLEILKDGKYINPSDLF